MKRVTAAVKTIRASSLALAQPGEFTSADAASRCTDALAVFTTFSSASLGEIDSELRATASRCVAQGAEAALRLHGQDSGVQDAAWAALCAVLRAVGPPSDGLLRSWWQSRRDEVAALARVTLVSEATDAHAKGAACLALSAVLGAFGSETRSHLIREGCLKAVLGVLDPPPAPPPPPQLRPGRASRGHSSACAQKQKKRLLPRR